MTTAGRLPAPVREAYLWPHRSWGDRIAVHRFVRDIPLGDRYRSFPEIEKIAGSLHDYRDRPVLIAWGGRDWCFDRTFFDEWTRRLPTARTLCLPDAGHWLLEDDPETLAREIGAFL